ncbi:ABC transporter substrate-binding protein [Cohnella sp. 56]|uniref:ABC transporter substrate-binding protein n=1 Tax=Cohnella sp. 56 TaxID=3113722 RepID=UPI0030E8D743
MNQRKKSISWTVVMTLLMTLLLSACGGNSNNGASSSPSLSASAPASSDAGATQSADASSSDWGMDKPITLLMYHSDPDYAKKMFDKVHEKFPNVTLDYVGGNIEDVVAAGQVPDLIVSGSPADIPKLQKLDLLAPLDGMIGSHGLVLSTIRDNMIDFYRSYGADNKLYMLPFDLATWGLYYNKKIFDKFGVAYPQDGMTWDQVLDIAEQLTRTEDGVQYIGLSPGPIQKMISQTGFGYVDPVSNKPVIADSPEMRKVMELLQRMIQIPGSLPKEKPYDWFMAQQWSGGGDFVSTQNVAMTFTWNNVAPYAKLEQENGLSWDVASWPIFGGDFPAVGPEADGQSMGISKHSKNQDAAFEVLKYILSEEFQSNYIPLSGKASSLNVPALDEEFKKLAPDKHLQAYIANPSAKSNLTAHSKYERDTWVAVDKGIELLIGGTDLNTVMTKMQEAAELAIQEAKKTE